MNPHCRIGSMSAAGAEEGSVVEVDDLLSQPGMYFNPQTEVVVIVDDSTSIDQEVFNMEAYEGADWVRISDEVPIDEDGRDRILEEFQTHNHSRAIPEAPDAAAVTDGAPVDVDAEDDEPETRSREELETDTDDEAAQDPGREG